MAVGKPLKTIVVDIPMNDERVYSLMRKLIFVLAVCLLLTACASTTNPTQPTTTQPTTNKNNTGSADLSVCKPTETYKTMEEYKQFIEQTDLPESFVYYEDLTQFGEFWLLVCTAERNDYNFNDPSRYSEGMYILKDEAGTLLGLDFGQAPSDVPIVESKYWGDMQAGYELIGRESPVRVIRNGISYLYLGSGLYSVSWESNGIKFCLTTDVKGEVFYPKDGPLTIVHELLHTDTNKAALEKINAALETPVVK